MKFGYARVSNAQDQADQVKALKAARCERIYQRKARVRQADESPSNTGTW